MGFVRKIVVQIKGKKKRKKFYNVSFVIGLYERMFSNIKLKNI